MLRMLRKIHRSFDEDASVDVSESDGVRSLHLGNATVQSAMLIKSPFELELKYTRGMMAYLLFAEDAADVLAIGLGGGSVPKYIYQHLPQAQIRVIEINPKIIRIARSHFAVPEDDERLRVIAGDGAAYLREHLETARVLMLDAFDSHGIPQDLCTQPFFDSCAAALSGDGIFVVNLWGSDRNFDVYLQRIEQSFERKVLTLLTGRPGNIVVLAFRRAPADLRWTHLRERARALEKTHKIEFLEFVETLREHNPNSANRLLMDA